MLKKERSIQEALAAVFDLIEQGYALFLPESRFCLKAITQLIPDEYFVRLVILHRDGSFAPLFLVHRRTLLEGQVTHPDEVRFVLCQEKSGTNNNALPVVRLTSFTATDERVAEVVQELLGMRKTGNDRADEPVY